MNIVKDYKNCPEIAKGSFIAIGNFDGVHKGHVTVINKAKELAQQKGLKTSVLTFEPHPLNILRPNIAPFRLTSESQKIKIMQNLGIDNLFIINFNQEFSQLSADSFINNVLVNALGAKHIVTGEDFIFGNKRSGNSALLEKASESCLFGYSKVAPVGYEEVFSSSLIRHNIKTGQLDSAYSMLGHNFSICGIVIEGAQKGRTIGFPTINIELGEYLRPAFGVYAVKINITGENTLYGAANIGTRPTVNGTKELLEVHIFDFNKNIYGQMVEIELINYIRPEKEFAGLDDLKQQIAKDCAQIKELIRNL